MSKQTTAAGDAVVVAMDQFLDWAIENLAPSTVEWHRHFGQSLKEHIGDQFAISDLLPSHVKAWLKKHPKWGRSTKNGAGRAPRLNPSLRAPLEWPLGGSFYHRGPDGCRDIDQLEPTLSGILANVVGEPEAGGIQAAWDCARRPRRSGLGMRDRKSPLGKTVCDKKSYIIVAPRFYPSTMEGCRPCKCLSAWWLTSGSVA
ncbi:MAG: hypothetical protein QM775_10435 [Pirellulales bacterium]